MTSGSYFQKTRALLTDVPFLEPVFSQLLPVLVITLTFALFYKLMPNTKVHFSAALVGGALAGTAWHSFNLFSLYLGSRAVNASASCIGRWQRLFPSRCSSEAGDCGSGSRSKASGLGRHPR